MSRTTFKWRGEQLKRRIISAAYEGLKECGKDLSEQSQKECPKDKGYDGGLVSTAKLVVDRAKLKLTLSYHKVYARRQHYEREWRHKPGEKAYYLKDPMDRNADHYLQVIAGKIRNKLGRK